MKKTSGIDALLEALKHSGMNVENGFGKSRKADSDHSSHVSSGNRTRKRQVPFNSSFATQVASWKRKALVIVALIIIVVGLVAYWWFHPPINIHSSDTWVFISVFVLLPLFLVFFSKAYRYRTGSIKVSVNYKKAKVFKLACFVPLIIVLAGMIGGLMSLPIFPGNAERYASVLKTTTDNFADDIKEANYSEIPIIDRDSSVLLGNREMGSIPEYVSQFNISPLYSQINYHGAPVRVSPLAYADLFKWFTNRDKGIPAYSLVDMTTQNAQIVKLEGRAIYYSESEPLERNIDRYIQLKYPFYMFDQKAFEIDEQGNPWWICPVQTRSIGLFGGTTINRVVMCDATTGETQDVSIEDVPQWVDRAYPADLLIEQYNWSGKYKDGWFNSLFGQAGVVQTTPGTDGNLGYNYIAKDDDVWVYTGVTSATVVDKSIVGFVLINQRTAESHFYAVSGATEESAMASAEGQVQNLRYTATFPLLINVANQPTYFMALKDNAGLVKKFAMIDIQRYQNVAVGDTVAECQKTYQALLATNGVTSDQKSDDQILMKQGTIEHITQAVIDNNSHFYVRLSGDDHIYDFALPALISIVGYTQGDSIAFSYRESEPTCPVQDFTDPKDDSNTSETASPPE